MKVCSVVFGVLLACAASLPLEQEREQGLSGLPPQTEQPSTDVDQSQPTNIRQKRHLLLGALGAGALGAGAIGAGVLGAGALGAGIIGAKAVGAGLVGGALASHAVGKSYGGYGGYGGGHGWGHDGGYETYYVPSHSYYYAPRTYIVEEGW